MTESLFFHLVYSQLSLGWIGSNHPPPTCAPAVRSTALSHLYCCHGYRVARSSKGRDTGGGSRWRVRLLIQLLPGAGATPVTALLPPPPTACRANVRRQLDKSICTSTRQPGGGTLHLSRRMGVPLQTATLTFA